VLHRTGSNRISSLILPALQADPGLDLPILHIHLQLLQLDRIQLPILSRLLMPIPNTMPMPMPMPMPVRMRMRQQRQHKPIQRRITRFSRAGIDAGKVLAARQALFAVAERAYINLAGTIAIATTVVVTVAVGMGVGLGVVVGVSVILGVAVAVVVVVQVHAVCPDIRRVALVIVATGGMWNLQIRARDVVDAVHAWIAVVRRMRQVSVQWYAIIRLKEIVPDGEVLLPVHFRRGGRRWRGWAFPRW